MDLLGAGEDSSVCANFQDAYQGLSVDVARLFRLLGLLPEGSFEVGAAAALAGASEDAVREALGALDDRTLIVKDGERFRLDDALRDRARERVEAEESPEERDAALRRVLDWYLAAADDAARSGDRRAECHMRVRAGQALLDLGRDEDAEREVRTARDIARDARHKAGEAAANEALGLVLARRGRWREAVEALEAAVALAEEGGDARAVLLVRHALGRAVCGSGDHERAIGLLQPLPNEFLALDRPDPYNRGRVLTSLGEAYLRTGRPETAIDFFGQAMDIMRGQDAVSRQAELWNHLADAARDRDDRDAERAARAKAEALGGRG
ncbi:MULTISPECIES: tetratricopeptide repeat protein [Actinomadura]|uniref:Tetratricopeptide repeat protein n=1 Tax=Actinomadura yumaensis TaxID=111807 RepID=A0ABW2C9X2_9ACTN|nr:tetratricopeptide repeat protein [Actinomadura sp. J1-007]MWK33942.1 tetratricopeptide repeat protein [Actinomadura sp. J1-007]